jgi:hypothetical protein
MSILKESGFIETIGMSVEEKLGALISSINVNNREFLAAMNDLGDVAKDHSADISELFGITAKLTKKMSHKASKLGLALVIIGGIAYVIKNESDKDTMKAKLLELDKNERGFYSHMEDEGEALNPEGPLGI